MKLSKLEEKLQAVLDQADVRLDGDRPFDIRIQDRKAFRSALKRGADAVLEAYVEGSWDVERLDVLTERLLSCNVGLPDGATLFQIWGQVQREFVQDSPKTGFFEAVLDKRMVYGSGYWKDAKDLDAAQEAKLALACRKLGLKKGMRVLDVGCGWGSFCQYAARNCQVSLVGVDLSENALELARQKCDGLPVELRKASIEELDEKDFDAAVSFGVLEYLEVEEYRSFFQALQSCLKPDGLLLLHTTGKNRLQEDGSRINECIEKPRNIVGAPHQVAQAWEGLFVLEDWHNYGADYDRTLMAWAQNLHSRWDSLKADHSERLYRSWRCYLLTCAGYYRAREVQVWELVLSPRGVPGGYRSQR